jgi:hypothetical protein
VKTIKICKEDARRLGLPAGVEVKIQPTKNRTYPYHHDVYYKGKFQGTLRLERQEGI